MGTKTAKNLLKLLLEQDGAEYIFGSEASPSESNPQAFDCSELVEWGCARLKIKPVMPDGAIYQIRHCWNYDLVIPVEQAIQTAGALLFYFSADPFSGGRPSGAHVAVSQGNGKTFEARSASSGVGAFSALNRGWTHAGLIPGLEYEESVTPAPPAETTATAAAEVREIKGKNYRVTAAYELNIRSGPGLDYEVVGTLACDEIVTSPDTAGWLPIVLDNETTGWVSKKFMQETSPESAPEEPPAPDTTTTSLETPGPEAIPGLFLGGLYAGQVQAIVPSLSDADANALILNLNPVLEEAEINTPLRQAAFIAQTAHETQGFSRFSEDLDYRADGLLEMFGKYFSEEEAEKYARQPEKIANRVYANRLGNGDEDSGDGWRYQGRGLIHLIGKDNYREAGRFLKLDLLKKPELAADLKVGARVAGWYWTRLGLNSYADHQQFDTITKKIAGSFIGLHQRRAYYKKAKEVLGA